MQNSRGRAEAGRPSFRLSSSPEQPIMPSPLAISPADDTGVPIVVQSHLRWDFVWQRPQQLLSRLSESHRVLFIEEPLFLDDAGTPSLALTLPMPRVHRAVPVLPAALRDRYDESIALVRELVRAQMAAGGRLAGLFERPIQWFYTPMPAPAMIGAFDERAVVYDCMDELSKFRFAPTALVDRERLLLASASVVFTGGHRLSQSKRKLHDNVHFFGCGVDVGHFAQARDPDLPVPDAIAALGRPVMGYYGVIDERIDYELLAKLSAAFPDAALVMVGPVVKVDPRELPKAPNIHWLGQRRYDELPAHLKGFDVCLMPFALNDATEFINPTKTLEYMAAAKPVVSTAISDVLHHFATAAEVATSHDEFIAAVARALEAPDAERIARGLEMACNNTWERVVSSMARIVREAVQARETRTTRVAAAAELVGAGVAARRARAPRIGLIAASEGSGD
jgi:glycosyltransferase involved in cell wall biosynthesis